MEPEVLVGLLGALATLAGAAIQRSWSWHRRRLPGGSEATEFGRFRENAAFSVDEVVKILDLRRSPGAPPGAPGTAVLTDTYLVRRQTDGGNGLISIYGTNGTLEGRCLTHPGAAHEFGPIESRHMAVNCAIGVDLAALALNNVMRVVNEVTYTGAYDRTPVEQFETHVDRPTRMLAIILLLPDANPAVDVTGYTQVGRRHESRCDSESGPVLTGDGTVAYWRIVPKKGEWLPLEARFAIEWRWRAASAERSPSRRAVAGEGA